MIDNPQLRKIRISDAFPGILQSKPLRFANPQPVGGFFPIMVTGGIGDLVMALPLIAKIKNLVGPVQVWSCNPRVHHYLGRGEDVAATELFPGFKYWFKIETAPNMKHSGTAAIANEAHAKFIDQAFTALSKHDNAIRYADYHPFCDGELARWGMERGLNRRTIMHYLSGFETNHFTEVHLKPPPIKYDIEPFITVHDGVDKTQTHLRYRSTKQWSLAHWKKLVAQIKEKFPHINVVQLGGPLSRPIPGVDFDFTGRFQIEQSLDMLSQSLLHIDGESGLVHAAHAMGVKSVVIFGPTESKFFGYKSNINLDPLECGGCFWVNRTWAKQCPIFDQPKCVDSITPAAVLEKIEPILSPVR